MTSPELQYLGYGEADFLFGDVLGSNVGKQLRSTGV